ncbi:SGNH/GDSL hydrolase family protein [Arthrobacter sp. FW306-06-A]|uniref:SGNH/GDSL hydrolase family protein n=1 Tax=Arthrobacter sp. FW306-06-A TaxID=2879621 RepID=UPI001F432F20|nr:GDSL-type esterase/lipase family protein [Arthrobacter sp. FW306-06-A]UKA69598.1 GDSL-type esterase/lipase family protein [Arthrobacter sp. FW306-06-A]
MSSGGIVAAGDSITNACSADLVVDGVPARSWVEWVAAAAGEPLTVHARPGAASATVRNLLPDTAERYRLGLVYVGVNNIISWRWWRRDDLEADLRDIVKRMSDRADRVSVMQYPDTLGRAGAVFPYGPFLLRRVRAAQAIAARVAAESGATLIKPPALTGDRMWIDGVHPTSTGHLAMGQAALSALGLPPVDTFAHASARPDFGRWRRRELVRFRLRQPVHGIGTWLLGR